MSQENENKPEDFDFDFNTLNPESDDSPSVGPPAGDDDFNPFADDSFSFGSDQSAETAPDQVPATENGGLDDLPMPSEFLTGSTEPDGASGEEAAEGFPAIDTGAVVAEEETDAKGKKKKKEKKKKEKKPKPEKVKKEKKPREPGSKEPIGQEGTACLILAGVLLVALVIANVVILLTSPFADYKIGASTMIYYLVGMNLIGLCGIVGVPLVFFVLRKELTFFKVAEGIAAMLMSLGVILVMTAFLRYDFTSKPTGPDPAAWNPVIVPVEPRSEESPEVEATDVDSAETEPAQDESGNTDETSDQADE